MVAVDWTEMRRRLESAAVNRMVAEKNGDGRRFLEEQYGADNVWDTGQVEESFRIVGFAAPYVEAIRKADGMRGTLMFAHSPRYYFDFRPAHAA